VRLEGQLADQMGSTVVYTHHVFLDLPEWRQQQQLGITVVYTQHAFFALLEYQEAKNSGGSGSNKVAAAAATQSTALDPMTGMETSKAWKLLKRMRDFGCKTNKMKKRVVPAKRRIHANDSRLQVLAVPRCRRCPIVAPI